MSKSHVIQLSFVAVLLVMALYLHLFLAQLPLYEFMNQDPAIDGPRIDTDGQPALRAIDDGDFDTALKHVKRLCRRARLWNSDQRYYAIESLESLGWSMQYRCRDWSEQGRRLTSQDAEYKVMSLILKELRQSHDPIMAGTLTTTLPKMERAFDSVSRP